MFGVPFNPGYKRVEGSELFCRGNRLNTEINDNPSLDLWQRFEGEVCASIDFTRGIRALSLSLSRPTIEILHPCLGQPRRINNIRLDFKADRATSGEGARRTIIEFGCRERNTFAFIGIERWFNARVYRSPFYFARILRIIRAYAGNLSTGRRSISLSNFCDRGGIRREKGFFGNLYCRQSWIFFFFLFIFERGNLFDISPLSLFFFYMLEILGMFVSIIFVCLWECLSFPVKICHRFRGEYFCYIFFLSPRRIFSTERLS